MTPDEFRASPPGGFFLNPQDPNAIALYLTRRDLFAPGESIVATASAGDGNMNCVVRVQTSHRSLILKQSRPWVEKYPQFAAPWDRACREMEFYRMTAMAPGVAGRMPRLLSGDSVARVLVLSDLGAGGDYSDLYRRGALSSSDLHSLADYLTELHGSLLLPAGAPSPLPNREMRTLNHAHLFVIPLARDNGLDLDTVEPGLASAAAPLKDDAELITAVADLGRDAYLADGPCLLHGDFYPGSLVRTPDGPRVIDPEFCFFGRPEFDVAVFLAHLALSDQTAEAAEAFRRRYRSPIPLDESLVRRLTGVEILRRVMGYAQLHADWPTGRRSDLLQMARRWIREG